MPRRIWLPPYGDWIVAASAADWKFAAMMLQDLGLWWAEEEPPPWPPAGYYELRDDTVAATVAYRWIVVGAPP
jgi:hypothetical protein